MAEYTSGDATSTIAYSLGSTILTVASGESSFDSLFLLAPDFDMTIIVVWIFFDTATSLLYNKGLMDHSNVLECGRLKHFR